MDQKSILKICTKCKIPKLLEEFSFDNKKKGYRKSRCKECINKYNRRYRYVNRETIRKRDRDRYKDDNEFRKHQSRLCYQNNQKYFKDYYKQHYKNNKNKIKKYKKKNIIYTRINQNKWARNKRKTDPIFRLRSSISTQIGRALKSNKSGRSWENLLGYTLIDLKLHLEKQFKSGMSWKNYGKWHIDHRKPVSWFKKIEKELLKAWRLDNLQPMWAKENLIKGNRWESPRIITLVK